MANFNTPGSGAKLINDVLKNHNKNGKQFVMQPLAGIDKGKKNLHTPESIKDPNTK